METSGYFSRSFLSLVSLIAVTSTACFCFAAYAQTITTPVFHSLNEAKAKSAVPSLDEDALAITPLKDPAVREELDRKWAAEELDQLGHRAQTLRYYYQHPLTQKIEQEVAADVQKFLDFAEDQRTNFLDRYRDEEFFKRQAVDKDQIMLEELDHGKAGLTLIDNHYVVRYVHRDTGLAFIILRPSQTPAATSEALWPGGESAEELQATWPQQEIANFYGEAGEIFGPEQAIDINSPHLKTFLARQVMDANKAKGRNAILVMLSSTGPKAMKLFVPGRVLPMYLPPKFLKSYWKSYYHATFFAPEASYFTLAVLSAVAQFGIVLTLDAAKHFLDDPEFSMGNISLGPAVVSAIWGLGITAFFKSYKNWLHRGDSQLKKNFRNYATKVANTGMLMAFGYGGLLAGTSAELFRRVGLNWWGSSLVKINLLEGSTLQRRNRENTDTLGAELEKHPWLQKIYKAPGMKTAIDKLKILDLKKNDISYQWYYNYYFLLKMVDLVGISLGPLLVSMGIPALDNEALLYDLSIGSVVMWGAIPYFQWRNKYKFARGYVEYLKKIEAKETALVNADPAQAEDIESELQRMATLENAKFEAAQNTFKRFSYKTYPVLVWRFLLDRVALLFDWLAEHLKNLPEGSSWQVMAKEFSQTAKVCADAAQRVDRWAKEWLRADFGDFMVKIALPSIHKIPLAEADLAAVRGMSHIEASPDEVAATTKAPSTMHAMREMAVELNDVLRKEISHAATLAKNWSPKLSWADSTSLANSAVHQLKDFFSNTGLKINSQEIFNSTRNLLAGGPVDFNYSFITSDALAAHPSGPSAAYAESPLLARRPGRDYVEPTPPADPQEDAVERSSGNDSDESPCRKWLL